MIARGRNALAALLLLTACASIRHVDTLYFGTEKPDHTYVTAEEWTRFLHEVVEPKVEGFTTWDALGGWKEHREPAHVLQIVHDGSANAAIDEIVAAYKKRFAQESVLRVRMRAGVAFQ